MLLFLLSPTVQERRRHRAGGLRESRQGAGYSEEGQRGLRFPAERCLHQPGTGMISDWEIKAFPPTLDDGYGHWLSGGQLNHRTLLCKDSKMDLMYYFFFIFAL